MSKKIKLSIAQKASLKKLLSLEKMTSKYENGALLTAYQTANRTISEKISMFYTKYAVENNITYAQAAKILSVSERKAVQTAIKEYYKVAKDLKADTAYLKSLNVLSRKAEITRLQALQLDIRHQIEVLSASNIKSIKTLETGLYKDAYYKQLYNESAINGLTGSFSKLDTKKVATAVNRGYNGITFSSSIWNNKTKLIQTLNQVIPQSFLTGSSVQTLAKAIKDEMNVSYNSAIRLARTETNRLNNESALDLYSEVMKGEEEIEVLATLDSATCEVCAAMDGVRVKLSDAQIGVNIPPFHPNDRCTTIRVFDEDNSERLAKINGEWVNVKDMPYNEFYSALEKGEKVTIK